MKKTIKQIVKLTCFLYFPLLQGSINLTNTTNQKIRFSFIFSGSKCANKKKLEKGGYFLEPGAANGFVSPDGNCTISGIKLKGRNYPVEPDMTYRIVSDGRKDFWIEG